MLDTPDFTAEEIAAMKAAPAVTTTINPNPGPNEPQAVVVVGPDLVKVLRTLAAHFETESEKNEQTDPDTSIRVVIESIAMADVACKTLRAFAKDLTLGLMLLDGVKVLVNNRVDGTYGALIPAGIDIEAPGGQARENDAATPEFAERVLEIVREITFPIDQADGAGNAAQGPEQITGTGHIDLKL